MDSIREQMAMIARRMFERRLTDMAGGNISARVGDRIFISPRYAGSKRHWQLNPEDFVEGPVDTDEIFSDPAFSREGKAHLGIYRNFPDVNGVIHAHPFHILPFCAAAKPIRPVLEQTQKFGVVEVVPAAPAHSADLANSIVAGLKGKEENIRKQAAALILPYHGIIVAGKDIFNAIDALERLDWNAHCLLTMNSIS